MIKMINKSFLYSKIAIGNNTGYIWHYNYCNKLWLLIIRIKYI